MPVCSSTVDCAYTFTNLLGTQCWQQAIRAHVQSPATKHYTNKLLVAGGIFKAIATTIFYSTEEMSQNKPHPISGSSYIGLTGYTYGLLSRLSNEFRISPTLTTLAMVSITFFNELFNVLPGVTSTPSTLMCPNNDTLYSSNSSISYWIFCLLVFGVEVSINLSLANVAIMHFNSKSLSNDNLNKRFLLTKVAPIIPIMASGVWAKLDKIALNTFQFYRQWPMGHSPFMFSFAIYKLYKIVDPTDFISNRKFPPVTCFELTHIYASAVIIGTGMLYCLCAKD